MLVTALHLFIAAILSIWLVLSVIHQFKPPWFEAIRQFDYFSLIPSWTFFAPNPGQSDYHVAYRDKFLDGSLSEWQEVDFGSAYRWRSCLWHPEKRSRKVLSDVVAALIDFVKLYPDPGVVMLSYSYLLILNLVMAQPRRAATAERQFVIAETSGYRRTVPPRVVLRSEYHAFPNSIALQPSVECSTA